MTPPGATSFIGHEAAARDHRRRRARRRRRRSLTRLTLTGVLVAILAAVAVPAIERALTQLTLPLEYSSIIRAQAADKHLDPALVAGVIYAETKFNPRASAAGAEGLMQILPQTAQFLARRSGATSFTTADLATPSVNIAYGCYYLRYLLDVYGGSVVPALAAYNGGEANVDRWLAQARAEHQVFTTADIPFPETRAYVQRVLQAQTDYRRTYPVALGYR